MPETLVTIKERVASVIQDTPGFITTEPGGLLDDAIRDALEQYSADVPRVVVADLDGTGSAFDFALPAAFEDGRSRLITVEYPTGARPASELEDDDWLIYRTDATVMFRLVDATPAATETVRLTFTTAQTLDGLDSADTTTIPAWHTQAFINLCASKCLYRLANRFLHEQETVINADSVDRGGKSDAARRLAGTFANLYAEQVGVSKGEAPAYARIDYDVSLAGIRGLSLTHDRRRR